MRMYFFVLPAYLSDGQWTYDWVTAMCKEYRKTPKEWCDFIESLRTPIFPTYNFGFTLDPPAYVAPAIPHPYFHRHIVADHLRVLLEKNMRLRWIMRKCLMRLRARICRRRIVGETDLTTMSPIPPRFLVEVLDIPTRSCYHFHASTLHCLIVGSLLHQSYALANPQPPKNPYTNLPWSLGQLISIVEQIQLCFLREHHRFLNPWVIGFRICKYNVELFLETNFRALQIMAAGFFFSDPQNLFFDSLYTETVDDLFEMAGYLRIGKVYRAVRMRNGSILSEQLLSEWDDHVVMAFVLINHEVLPAERYKSRLCFETAISKTYRATLEHLKNESHGVQEPQEIQDHGDMDVE